MHKIKDRGRYRASVKDSSFAALSLPFVFHCLADLKSFTLARQRLYHALARVLKFAPGQFKGVHWRGNRCPYFQNETTQH